MGVAKGTGASESGGPDRKRRERKDRSFELLRTLFRCDRFQCWRLLLGAGILTRSDLKTRNSKLQIKESFAVCQNLIKR
jgi:hypothetical protein